MANSRPGDWPPSRPSTSSFTGPPYCVNGYEHEQGLDYDPGATYPMAMPDLDSPDAWIRPEPLGPRPVEMAWTEPPPGWSDPGWAGPEWAGPGWAGPEHAAPPSDPWDQPSHGYSFSQMADPIRPPDPWERERAARGVRTMWLIAFAVGMFVLTILVFRWYGA